MRITAFITLLVLAAATGADDKTIRLAFLERPDGIATRFDAVQVVRYQTRLLESDAKTPAERRDVYLARARSYWTAGEAEDAVADLKAAAKLDPQALPARRLLASYKSTLEKSETHLEKFVADHPTDCEGRLLYAEWLLDAAKAEPALAQATKAIALVGGDGALAGCGHYLAARCHRDLGHREKALDAIDAANARLAALSRRVHPGQVRQLRGTILFDLERYADAEAEAELVLTMQSYNTHAWCDLWRCQLVRSAPKAAYVLTTAFRKHFPDDPLGPVLHAASCTLNGLPEEALEAVPDSKDAAGKAANWLLQRAIALQATGKAADAKAYLNKIDEKEARDFYLIDLTRAMVLVSATDPKDRDLSAARKYRDGLKPDIRDSLAYKVTDAYLLAADGAFAAAEKQFAHASGLATEEDELRALTAAYAGLCRKKEFVPSAKMVVLVSAFHRPWPVAMK